MKVFTLTVDNQQFIWVTCKVDSHRCPERPWRAFRIAAREGSVSRPAFVLRPRVRCWGRWPQRYGLDPLPWFDRFRSR